jgi:hypothetical protein
MGPVSATCLMKPTPNSTAAKNLAWFIDLLNDGRRPEPSADNSRKPEIKKKREKKKIDLLKVEPSPDGLRAEIGGLMGTILNLLLGFKGSSGALRQANQIAIQSWSSPQFVVDRSGKLLVYKAARPEAGARAWLLIDAMNVLTYLVERGRLSRLKCCPGYRSPQYRGEPLRRCSLWFDGASNKTYHSPACGKKAERVRNKEKYKTRQRKLMRKKRKEEKEERRKDLERENRTEFKLRGSTTRTSKPKVKVR